MKGFLAVGLLVTTTAATLFFLKNALNSLIPLESHNPSVYAACGAAR